MKNKHVFLLLAVALFALASVSCGKRHSAKQLVEDFIDEHAQLSSVSVTDVGKLDSTDRVDNTTISALQADVKMVAYINPTPSLDNVPRTPRPCLCFA